VYLSICIQHCDFLLRFSIYILFSYSFWLQVCQSDKFLSRLIVIYFASARVSGGAPPRGGLMGPLARDYGLLQLNACVCYVAGSNKPGSGKTV